MNKLSFAIYVTTKCNMECTYCYEKKYIPMDMTMDVANKIVAFINQKKLENNIELVNIHFHGGEPLLAFSKIKFFIEEFDKIQKNINVDFVYSTTINGTLLEDKMIPTLSRFHELSISIDGNEEIHNKNRVFHNKQGTYDIMRKNINKLLGLYPKLTARMTITPSTYSSVFNSFLHILDIGFHNIELELDFTNENWTNDMILEYTSELKKIANKVYKLKQNNILINVPLLERAKSKNKNSICNGGTTSFVITPNGKVYPCTFAINNNEFLLGNIDEKFDEKVLNNINKVGKIKNEMCNGCSRYDYCMTTRCKLVNYICTGDYFTPSPIICVNENVNVTIGKYFIELMSK